MTEALYILVAAIVVVILSNFFARPREKFDGSQQSESAADACRTISSEADKIKAQLDGAAKLAGEINPLSSIIKAIKGGDNTVDSTTRNIIESNMSSKMRVKIANDCANSSATIQTNSLDTSNCEYCKKNGCSVSNVRQINSSELEQKCILSSAVQSLMEQTDSIQQKALAQAIQKTDGLLSGNNNNKTSNCNITRKDMSQQQYIEAIAKCANKVNVNQSNVIKNCGPVINVVQENISRQIQQCINDTTTNTQSKQDASSQQDAKSLVDQLTKGTDVWGSIAVLLVFCCSFCISSILSSMFSSSDVPVIRNGNGNGNGN